MIFFDLVFFRNTCLFCFLSICFIVSSFANGSEPVLSHQPTGHLLAKLRKKSEHFPKNLKKPIDIRSNKKSTPSFDRKNPKAKGIIITFNQFPPNQKKIKPLLRKLKKEGLKLKSQFPFLESWVFEWAKWQKAKKAQILCLELVTHPQLSHYAKVCEPDFLLKPEEATEISPSYRLKKVEEETPSFQINMSRNLKSCGIVSQKIKEIKKCDGDEPPFPFLKGLPDYWAQEMIGADLLNKELKKNNFSGPNSHAFLVMDSFEANHSKAVRSLISHTGENKNNEKISVLPSTATYGSGYQEVLKLSTVGSYYKSLCRPSINTSKDCKPVPSFINHSMSWGYGAFCALEDTPKLLKDIITESKEKGKLVLGELEEKFFQSEYTYLAKEYQTKARTESLSEEQIKEFICSADRMSTYRTFKEINSLGTIIVTSADNDHPNNGHGNSPFVHLPKRQASKDFGLIIVGSVRPSRKRSSFSQEGKEEGEVDIMAPSDHSLVAEADGKACLFSGTSGAASLVTASLVGFEWLSGYHPTDEEAKSFLKKTAIPYFFSENSDRGVPSSGIVNAYKLGRVAQKLKKRCKNDRHCFKNAIKEDQTYQFDRDQGLSEAIALAFPECTVCGSYPLKTGAAACKTKRDVFTRLRKETFLHPKNRELWNTLACVYGSSDFKKTAKGITNTSRSLSGTQGINGYYCGKDEDCVFYPLPPKNKICHENFENISAFEVVNKVAFKIKNIRKNIGKCCQWETACMRQWCHPNNRMEVTPVSTPVKTTQEWHGYQAHCDRSQRKCSMKFKLTKKRVPLRDESKDEELDVRQ